MRYIYEVSRTGSFSKAAENLYVSQPALSKSIKKTEDAIGMPLFDRRAHPLQLTEAGQAYLKAIEKILLAEKDLSDQIRDIRDLEKGQISIGGSNYVNTSILPDVLTSFQERYPGVQIRLVEFSSARLSQMLAKNELDLTFSCNMEFMQDFKKQEAFRDRLLMAVPWNAPINETLGDRSYGVEEIIQGDHLRMKKPPRLPPIRSPPNRRRKTRLRSQRKRKQRFPSPTSLLRLLPTRNLPSRRRRTRRKRRLPRLRSPHRLPPIMKKRKKRLRLPPLPPRIKRKSPQKPLFRRKRISPLKKPPLAPPEPPSPSSSVRSSIRPRRKTRNPFPSPARAKPSPLCCTRRISRKPTSTPFPLTAAATISRSCSNPLSASA